MTTFCMVCVIKTILESFVHKLQNDSNAQTLRLLVHQKYKEAKKMFRFLLNILGISMILDEERDGKELSAGWIVFWSIVIFVSIMVIYFAKS